MNRILRAALAATALALVCSPAMAQSAFPTPGGSYVDGKALMCPNGSNLMVPCGSAGTPIVISGTFSASLAGWQPTPSYSQLAASDALNHSVAVPSGPDDVVMNLDTNVVYCNAGAAATVNTYPIQPGSGVAWHNPGGTTFTTVQCLSPSSTLKVTIAGGTGLWTASGGGGGGSGSFPTVVGTPGSNIPANGLLVGAWQPTSGFYENLLLDATQALKVGFSGAAQPFNLTQAGGSNLGAPTTVGTQGTGLAINTNATIVGGSVSASFSGFNSGGVYATPLAVGTTTASVAAPAGATVVVFNTGSVPVFTTIHATSATATTAMDQISPGGCWAYVQTGSEFIAGITASGTSVLNISGGSGWPVGCGGGGSSGGGPVTNAGTSATTAAAVQGVTGGVPIPATLGVTSGATIPISISTATTTQLIALSAGKAIYVTSWDVIAGGTGNITLEYGTGSLCGTGTTALTGAYPLAAQAGVAKGDGIGTILIVPSGNALCAVTSAAVQMSGSMSYTQQ